MPPATRRATKDSDTYISRATWPTTTVSERNTFTGQDIYFVRFITQASVVLYRKSFF